MISRKFATSYGILVAKGKNLFANGTELVAISSPEHRSFVRIQML